MKSLKAIRELVRDTLDQFVLHFEAWKKKRPKQRIKDLECTVYCLKSEITILKKILEKGRFHNFIWTVQYIPGMKISLVDERPNPISLEDLEKRMAQVEASLQNPTGHAPARSAAEGR